MNKDIRLYWWSERYIQKKDFENYGDLLGKYIVEKITNKKVIWLRANRFYIKNLWRPVYVTIGSILEHIGNHCIVWGSGVSHRDAQIARATFTAVRGPLSRKRILELGYDCPEVYGDPALLLPLHYDPKVERLWELGIIPHINDYKVVLQMFQFLPEIKVIDFMTNDIEQTTKEIVSCKKILSSSLHGIIVPHAYGIPAIQVRFSDNIYGDGVKYQDYFLSVNLKIYTADVVKEPKNINYWTNIVDQHESRLPQKMKIEMLQNDLKAVCPFKKQEQ
ncbi:exosortase [Nonlabens sp. YIK11]|uniref:polysaccharide pyruvyl transferase family protein n=1 Tax=Nonlabens sp. YIK11 TaxID=1453349 RepID=UPI0006DC1048|nr:polysaccharide pyruvyl transferase family protein [Nonlabens sp. YIK11]KQC34149.1 exosortase [Nonlabens sp. YIK11]